jgi:hypothetical protein
MSASLLSLLLSLPSKLFPLLLSLTFSFLPTGDVCSLESKLLDSEHHPSKPHNLLLRSVSWFSSASRTRFRFTSTQLRKSPLFCLFPSLFSFNSPPSCLLMTASPHFGIFSSAFFSYFCFTHLPL